MARRHRPLFPLPRPRRNRYAPSSRQSPLHLEHPPKAAIPHAAPLPLLSKSNPLALGFDLVLGASLEAAGIYTAVIFHVGAKSALLRRLFIPMAKKTSSARFLAPPFQITTAVLGCDLVLGANLKPGYLYGCDIPKKKHLRKQVLLFWEPQAHFHARRK